MREILSPSLAERTSLHLGGRAIAELVLERAGDYPLLAERLQQLGGGEAIPLEGREENIVFEVPKELRVDIREVD